MKKKVFSIANAWQMTQRDIARVFGIARQTCAQWSGPQKCPRNEDKTYNLTDVIQWKMTRLEEENCGSENDNPELRRLRTIKANREELKYFEEKKEYVKIEDIRIHLQAFSQMIRQAGATLQKEHGAEAKQVLDDALDRCDAILDQEFGEKKTC